MQEKKNQTLKIIITFLRQRLLDTSKCPTGFTVKTNRRNSDTQRWEGEHHPSVYSSDLTTFLFLHLLYLEERDIYYIKQERVKELKQARKLTVKNITIYNWISDKTQYFVNIFKNIKKLLSTNKCLFLKSL